MELNKKKLIYLGGSIIGLSAGIASTVGQRLLDIGINKIDPSVFAYAGIVVTGSVAVNLLSNTAQNICSAISNKVIIAHPNELNHDLQKALVVSVEKALWNILILYDDKKPTKKDKLIVKDFIKTVESDLKNIFKQNSSLEVYHEQIKNYIHTPFDQANADILKKIHSALSNELPQGFLDLFVDKYTEQFRICFTQVLKDKSDAWIAFEKMMLEVIKVDLQTLIAGQKEIEKSLIDLKQQNTVKKLLRIPSHQVKALENLLKEINQPSRIQIALDAALNELFDVLKKELVEIKGLAIEMRSELKDFRKDFDKGKTDWWSRKLIISYGVVFIVSILVLIIIYHYSHQPFMVTIAVNGPKGIGDKVLEGPIRVGIQYGDKREEQILNEMGEAYFKQIPGEYSNDSTFVVLKGLEGEPYKQLCIRCKYKLGKNCIINVPLVAIGLDKVEGIVVDQNRIPIIGAAVYIEGINKLTDENGSFTIRIPIEKQKRLVDITVSKKGYLEETINKLPPHLQTKPVEIQLLKMK